MDISLYYQEQGKGEPFILLHGNGEDGTYFVNQIGFFSDQYRVIAVDTRGRGKSPRGTAPFTMEQFADDLYELMNELQIPGAVILGFSDGANIAMKFALKYPQKVTALILNGGNLDTKGIKRRIQIPTLVIAGTRDMIKQSHTELIAASIPDAKLAIVKGSHFIANKRSSEFNKEVGNFLNGVDVR